MSPVRRPIENRRLPQLRGPRLDRGELAGLAALTVLAGVLGFATLDLQSSVSMRHTRWDQCSAGRSQTRSRVSRGQSHPRRSKRRGSSSSCFRRALSLKPASRTKIRLTCPCRRRISHNSSERTGIACSPGSAKHRTDRPRAGSAWWRRSAIYCLLNPSWQRTISSAATSPVAANRAPSLWSSSAAACDTEYLEGQACLRP
jgi:hypothetical protein